MTGSNAVTDTAAVRIWAAMVALGQPTKDSPTIPEIRAALAAVLRENGLRLVAEDGAHG